METIEKISKYLFVTIAVICSFESKAVNYFLDIIPKDILTIEALIDSHKKMAKYEQEAAVELAVNTGTTEEGKSSTEKAAGIRNVMFQKLADTQGALALGFQFVGVATQLGQVITEEINFTKEAYIATKDNPLAAAVYAKYDKDIGRLAKFVSAKIVNIVGYETNILKASTAEKKRILDNISSCLREISYHITSGRTMIRRLMAKPIEEFIFSKEAFEASNKEIMSNVLKSWNVNI